MKKIYLILWVFTVMFFVQSSFAQTDPYDHNPDPNGPDTGGGGSPYGSLIYLPFNSSGYNPSSAIVGELKLYDFNGPSFSSSSLTQYATFGFDATGSDAVNFATFAPGSVFISSPLDNRARSATFSGNVMGRVFRFYDSPNGITDHDWTEIYFRQNPPANYSYFLWTFESTYADQYVIVTYHPSPYHGIDGSVSRYETNIQ